MILNISAELQWHTSMSPSSRLNINMSNTHAHRHTHAPWYIASWQSELMHRTTFWPALGHMCFSNIKAAYLHTHTYIYERVCVGGWVCAYVLFLFCPFTAMIPVQFITTPDNKSAIFSPWQIEEKRSARLKLVRCCRCFQESRGGKKIQEWSFYINYCDIFIFFYHQVVQ